MLACLLIIFFFGLSAFSIRGKSLTYDEPYHYKYGLNLIHGNSTRFDDSKMPFSALNALPARVAEFLPAGWLKEQLNKTITARLMTTVFSSLVGGLVFIWSRELYGAIPGLVSLLLYILDPNIIAHSQLITTDIYATGMTLFGSYRLWKFANSRTWRNGLVFAFVLGLAQLAKYTTASLYLLFLIQLLLHDSAWLKQVAQTGARALWREVGQYLLYIAVVAFTSILIINAGFLFNHSFTWLSDYQFKSMFFRDIQAMINFPVPTPYPFLEGFDWILAKERTSLGFVHIYLMGQTRLGAGFPGYFVTASTLKMPLASQFLALAAFVTFLRDPARRVSLWKNEWFQLWLLMFYTVYFNFFYHSQIGIRHYLIVFPLLYVFIGSLFQNWRGFTRLQVGASVLMGIFLLTSIYAKYPNYLSYFNELIGDGSQAYKYLADSNLEWGQDTHLLEAYKKDHPRSPKAPETPALISEITTYYVSINRLVGVIDGPENYRWLRENFSPTGKIGNSYLLYTITPAEMNQLCKRSNYCK